MERVPTIQGSALMPTLKIQCGACETAGEATVGGPIFGSLELRKDNHASAAGPGLSITRLPAG